MEDEGAERIEEGGGMEGSKNERIEGWTDGMWKDGRIQERKDRGMDGWKAGRRGMEGWMGRKVGRKEDSMLSGYVLSHRYQMQRPSSYPQRHPLLPLWSPRCPPPCRPRFPHPQWTLWLLLLPLRALPSLLPVIPTALYQPLPPLQHDRYNNQYNNWYNNQYNNQYKNQYNHRYNPYNNQYKNQCKNQYNNQYKNQYNNRYNPYNHS
jgi:hypothetical protein